jgi:hypothetical protein
MKGYEFADAALPVEKTGQNIAGRHDCYELHEDGLYEAVVVFLLQDSRALWGPDSTHFQIVLSSHEIMVDSNPSACMK